MSATEDPATDRLREAMRLLEEEARARLERHPSVHLKRGGNESLELRLTLSLGGIPEDRDRDLERASEALDEGVRGVVSFRSAFRPGHVFCFRCRSARCEHTVPTDGRHVFSGYGATGVPGFVDLGKWFLDKKDPRVDLLYRDGASPVLADVVRGGKLTEELLPAFRDRERGFFLHGQVVAGWYRVPDAEGVPQPVAVTLQVVSSKGRKSGRRFGLNVVGAGPDGAGLEAVGERLGEAPWRPAARWAQATLDSIERSVNRKGRTPERIVRERLERLLKELARRLEQGQRSRGRRTRHAQERHDGGDRPTGKARADLAKAGEDRLLFDPRRGTVVVLGDRGRVHFFSTEGKHVTSVQYAPEAIQRRRKQEVWRSARPEEVGALRAAIARHEEATERNGES